MIARSTQGFTLLEVLMALTILAVIVTIVFMSFAAVVESTDDTRGYLEAARSRQLLIRTFLDTFSTVYVDKLVEDEMYRFYGEDSDGGFGDADTLYFTSTSTLLGGKGLPGELIQITWELTEPPTDSFLNEQPEDEQEGGEDERPRGRTLIMSETPLQTAMVDESWDSEDDEPLAEQLEYDSPRLEWDYVEDFNLQYYDGEEWLDEWDSLTVGRLPWCVRIQINFVKTDAERDALREAGIDVTQEYEFELVAPIPIGMGIINEPPMTDEFSGIVGQDADSGDDGNDSDKDDK